jgi:hypothetical protein
MRPLRLKLQEVIDAMATPGDEGFSPYLDLQDGTVHWLGEHPDDRDFEPDRERHVEIPRNEARDDYDLMCQFADTVDPDLADLLAVALEGSGAFGRFRGVMSRFPDEQQRWYAFKDQADRARALAWLSELGIQPTDVSVPHRARPQAAPDPAVAPAVYLTDLLLLGAPDGKTELIDGQVVRMVHASSESQARRWFRDLARQVCEESGLPWHKRLIEGKRDLDVDRFHLKLDGSTVVLAIDVARATWETFS